MRLGYLLFCWVLVVGTAFGSQHRVVVQLNVPGTIAAANTMEGVRNLQRALAPEPVEVEIVCQGPGIDLLLSHDNPLADRVRKLQKSGVVFVACGNTLKGRKINRARLLPKVKVVEAGIAEVVRKQEAGWSYIKGG